MPHFWRVNTLTPSGWVTSATGTFVPCSGPILLWGPLTCEADGTATVHFRWSPGAPQATYQWLDIAKGDASFAPGTFFGVRLFGTESELIVTQLHGNSLFYFRVNAHLLDHQSGRGRTGNEWQASETGGFMTNCLP